MKCSELIRHILLFPVCMIQSWYFSKCSDERSVFIVDDVTNNMRAK